MKINCIAESLQNDGIDLDELELQKGLRQPDLSRFPEVCPSCGYPFNGHECFNCGYESLEDTYNDYFDIQA